MFATGYFIRETSVWRTDGCEVDRRGTYTLVSAIKREQMVKQLTAEGEMKRQTDGRTDRQVDGRKNTQPGGQMDGWTTDRPTHGKTGRQVG